MHELQAERCNTLSAHVGLYIDCKVVVPYLLNLIDQPPVMVLAIPEAKTAHGKQSNASLLETGHGG